MDQIAVIGPSWMTNVAYAHAPLRLDTTINIDYVRNYTGGVHTVAHDAAALGGHVSLVTRLSGDDVGRRMQQELDALGVITYLRDGGPRTPTEFVVTDGQHFQRLTDLRYDSYLNAAGDIPMIALEGSDCCIAQMLNSPLLAKAVSYCPQALWVALRAIPDDDVLPLIDTVALSYHDVTRSVAPDDFGRLATELLGKGLRHLLISDRGMGAWLYDIYGGRYLQVPGQADRIYYLGSLEVMVSAMAVGASRHMPYLDALQVGLSLVGQSRLSPSLLPDNLHWPEE